MRYVIIFVGLLLIFIVGWFLGATSFLVRKEVMAVGTLHMDKDFDYIWQLEFNKDTPPEEIKKRQFIVFKVDSEAKLSQ